MEIFRAITAVHFLIFLKSLTKILVAVFKSYWKASRRSLTWNFPVDRRLKTGPHGGLSWGILIRDGTSIWVGIEQQERLVVAPHAFGGHIFPLWANLKGRVILWILELHKQQQKKPYLCIPIIFPTMGFGTLNSPYGCPLIKSTSHHL